MKPPVTERSTPPLGNTSVAREIDAAEAGSATDSVPAEVESGITIIECQHGPARA